MPMSFEASLPALGFFIGIAAAPDSTSVSARVAYMTTLSLLETFPNTFRCVLLSKEPYAFLVGTELAEANILSW